MSSVSHPTDPASEVRLAAIAAKAMGGDPEFVSVRLAGRRIVLQGVAPSYTAKARAVASLRLAGYRDVENCLRVAPGLPVLS